MFFEIQIYVFSELHPYSVARQIKLHFKSETIEWFLYGDHTDLDITFSTADPLLTKEQLLESLHIVKSDGHMLTFNTWFGLKVALRDEFIAVKPALAYRFGLILVTKLNY